MANTKWVAAWGCAETYTHQNVSNIIEDTTFRYVIYSPLAGSKIRLYFSNRLGHRTAKIDKVSVAPYVGGGKVDTEKAIAVTFGGKRECVMQAGESLVSDEVEFDTECGKNFAISLYIKDQTELWCGHWNSGHFIKKFYGVGDYADEREIDVDAVGDGGPYVFLYQADVLTSEDCSAVVAFGDSITAQPWPDWLAHRIVESGITNRSVIRRGIGGNRILREYKCRMKRHYGEIGVNRFERDVSIAGADKVFLLHGVNDIIHPNPDSPYCPMEHFPSFEDMVGGYQHYIDTAHRLGMKIYIATLLPMHRKAADPARTEDMRCRINEWLRANKEIDGLIDFEAAVWSEENHKVFEPVCDSGDHLHPSVEGARRMAYCIPEEFYKN